MQAVILAAGLGTRMGELTKNCPKPLLKIEERTLLEHNLTAMPDEIDEVVLVVGYLADQIKEVIGEKFLNKKIIYVHQKELRGTGHALSVCKDVLRGRFLVLMGDDLYEKEDLKKLISHPLAVLSQKLKNPGKDDSYALIKMDEHGKLLDIVERQQAKPGDLANSGAYVLDERYFNLPLVPAGNKTDEFGLPQTMLELVKQGAKFDITQATFWHKVTSPKDLRLENPSS
jgi:bifunctional UDP-N-acetylglucosamine pyrophosphorylase/glucosamine-1-phosphate N-acetyltransferase